MEFQGIIASCLLAPSPSHSYSLSLSRSAETFLLTHCVFSPIPSYTRFVCMNTQIYGIYSYNSFTLLFLSCFLSSPPFLLLPTSFAAGKTTKRCQRRRQIFVPLRGFNPSPARIKGCALECQAIAVDLPLPQPHSFPFPFPGRDHVNDTSR